MKYIKLPPSVALTSIINGQQFNDEKGQPAEIDLKQLLLARLADPVWVKSAKSIMQQSKIKSTIDSANGVLALEDADYEALAAVVKEPSPGVGYDSRCSHCLVPLFQAFENTSETNPEAH